MKDEKAEAAAPQHAQGQDSKLDSLQSRRSFLRTSGLLAATGAAGLPLAASAAAKEAPGQPLPLPAAFAVSAKTPYETPKLPMNGATLFAVACKAEGLAALFCCPGNYTVTHAMANIGIPVYTGPRRALDEPCGRRLHPRHGRSVGHLRHRGPRLHQPDFRPGQRQGGAHAGALPVQ
jgi:hypothetical protein